MRSARRNFRLILFVSISTIACYYLNLLLNYNVRILAKNDVFSYKSKDPMLTADYGTNLEKLRNLLEPQCSCHLDKAVCFSQTEFDDYRVFLKSGNATSSYKLELYELDNANIGCNPFHVLRRGKNQKVISYTLSSLSSAGVSHLKRLVRAAKLFYPDWVIRVHHNGCLDQRLVCEVECLVDGHGNLYDNLQFCDVRALPAEAVDVARLPYTFWKWLPMGDLFVGTFLSRDWEACIGNREAVAVNEWLNTKYLFHTMRDRPDHKELITTGLWGMQTNRGRDVANYLFKKLTDPNPAAWRMKHYNSDSFEYEQQSFLAEIRGFMNRNLLVHDSFFCEGKLGVFRPFSVKRTAAYCFHTGEPYGCCNKSKAENDYYGHKDLGKEALEVCPSKCRPAKKKDWIFC